MGSGANVAQLDASDVWCFMDQGDGFYTIKNRKIGLILDTANGKVGAKVVVKHRNNASRTPFRLLMFVFPFQPTSTVIPIRPNERSRNRITQ